MSSDRLKSVEQKTVAVVTNHTVQLKVPYLIYLVDKRAFLANGFPIMEAGLLKAKGVYLDKVPTLEKCRELALKEVNSENIFEVYFPPTSVKEIVNLLFKGK